MNSTFVYDVLTNDSSGCLGFKTSTLKPKIKKLHTRNQKTPTNPQERHVRLLRLSVNPRLPQDRISTWGVFLRALFPLCGLILKGLGVKALRREPEFRQAICVCVCVNFIPGF